MSVCECGADVGVYSLGDRFGGGGGSSEAAQEQGEGTPGGGSHRVCGQLQVSHSLLNVNIHSSESANAL